MSPADLLVVRFMLASAGCVAAGLGVWTLARLLGRWPGFQLQRSTWLLGQLTIAAAFLVILLPHGERFRLIPPIELDGAALASAPFAAKAAAPASLTGIVPSPNAGAGRPSWFAVAARGWLIAYALGLAYAILRLRQAQRVLRALAGAGCPAPDYAGVARARGLEVIEVDAPISPMLFGLFRPRLLLPRHLRSFEALQQQMIIEHELTHLRRHDLHWMSAGILLQTLLWFNPFMRLLRAQLSWAQELGCDRDVLSAHPPLHRKAYAAALLAQFTSQHRRVNAALAFGGLSANGVAARISLIRQPAARGRWGRLAALGAMALVFGASLAFQPALAWRSDWPPVAPSPALSCTVLADAATGERLVHEGQCDQRVTPASTFNIAISLMGYDSGILIDEHAPALPFKPGYADWNPAWRATTDPSSWLAHSVVWYAQRVTAQLGPQRFQRYVRHFDYGNQDVAGDAGKNNGLAMSWISSSLAISPVEQVGFLRKMVNRELAVTAQAFDMTARIMQSETLANGWLVHGKTGTANPVLANGKDDPTRHYGWYVGWAQKGERKVVFARLILDRRQATSAGWRVKQAFLRELPARLDRL